MLKGRFFGYPKYYDVKPPGPDGKMWIVQNPGGRFGFKLEDGRTITPPDGMLTDYASVPRFVWRLIGPPTGFGKKANYGPASILHDTAYIHKKFDKKPCSRREADQMMVAAMKEMKVSRWRRVIMYTALRIGGRKHFGRKEEDTVF